MHLCPKCLCAKTFCAQCFFLCKRLLSDSKSFLACRTAEMSWDELRGDETARMRWKQLRGTYLDDLWEEMGWNEKSSAHMIWDEMKCRAWSASVKCEVQGVKRALWSVWKALAWRCFARGRAQVMTLGQHQRNSFAQSTRARAWLAHGARKFYIDP